jgi:hypothetical protein
MNPELTEVTQQLARSLYLFVAFFAGIYIGYIFGFRDGSNL